MNEEDFSNISELVSRIVAGITDDDSIVFTSFQAIFLHNGNVYENSSIVSTIFHELIDEVNRLSPLSIRWH